MYTAREEINGPFAVINADDYYGLDAFNKMGAFLSDRKTGNYGMIGYLLKNTVSDYGYVSRGVCSITEDNLSRVEEKVRIEKRDDDIAYYENDGWYPLQEDCVVSMNMWGFDQSFIHYIQDQIVEKLEKGFEENPKKFEYFLPFVVDEMLQSDMCCVKCMVTDELWYGITYEEDKERVVKSIELLKSSGRYPEKLWGGHHA